LPGDLEEVLIGIFDLAVARIGEHGNHSQVIHLHHFQDLLGAEHFLFIGTATTNTPVDVRIPGKPIAWLNPRGSLGRAANCAAQSDGQKCETSQNAKQLYSRLAHSEPPRSFQDAGRKKQAGADLAGHIRPPLKVFKPSNQDWYHARKVLDRRAHSTQILHLRDG
jgi:hypothetical protein